jgi:hypothetical protein
MRSFTKESPVKGQAARIVVQLEDEGYVSPCVTISHRVVEL